MEEDRSASPPLPSKGAYNIDFDALDDSFNPFESKKSLGNSPELARKGMQHSPPLGRKTIQHSPPVGRKNDSEVTQGGDGDVPVGGNLDTLAPPPATDTPKKKKSKSPKRASKEKEGTSEGKGHGDGPQVSALTDGDDKPVR